MEKQIKLLRATEQTLGKITVSGAENLDMLLGCILTLRSVTASLEAFGKEDGNAAIHEKIGEEAREVSDGVFGA